MLLYQWQSIFPNKLSAAYMDIITVSIRLSEIIQKWLPYSVEFIRVSYNTISDSLHVQYSSEASQPGLKLRNRKICF